MECAVTCTSAFQLQRIFREAIYYIFARSLDNAVGIATGYGMDDGVRIPVRSRISFSPRRSDRFCGPLSLLLNGYQGSFPVGKEAAA
jgi:hypothetical protein